ncbi:toxin-antitoxin system TumE family protein [Persicitalea jodogahamensis]|uniref:Uncharacterized protein n=1 Tax=Persicitalea jodogahamensis TaxID=402147 RepID=A0A8J3D1M7_9BACT|nr:DUF6516 family protein [Persicitalea jodogahamensis]GHB57376.1 hypothetical protein GCM10007390_08500 [Persicitalea jodogahamensis]
MKELIDSFAHIIDSYEVLKDQENPKITELKIRIFFIDQSILEYTEVNVIQPTKRKYSFQWMKPDYKLLVRWDNAFHHPHIATHPHHNHVNEEKNILESPEMTLMMVLQEIDDRISI